LIAAFIPVAVKHSYEAAAVVTVDSADAILQGIKTQLTRRALWGMIERHHLYEADRFHIPNEEIVDKLRHAITIERQPLSEGQPQRIHIAYKGPDPAGAKEVTEDLVRTVQQLGGNAIEMRVQAQHDTPPWLRRAMFMMTGAVGGLLIGAVLAKLTASRLPV
jgi:uncharacterized protein involved in exopolysaccharide biosynthesis